MRIVVRILGGVSGRHRRDAVLRDVRAHRAQHEGVQGLEVGGAGGRLRRRRAPAHDAGVHERDDLSRVLGRDRLGGDGVGEDLGEHLRHESGMCAQTAGRSARDRVRQRAGGGEVEVPFEQGLLAHVDAQPVDGILDAGQRGGELFGIAGRLMLHERQEEILLVREVVVDRGAPDTGVRGDVRQGDLVEGVLGHQLREGVEQGGPCSFAVLGE